MVVWLRYHYYRNNDGCRLGNPHHRLWGYSNKKVGLCISSIRAAPHAFHIHVSPSIHHVHNSHSTTNQNIHTNHPAPQKIKAIDSHSTTNQRIWLINHTTPQIKTSICHLRHLFPLPPSPPLQWGRGGGWGWSRRGGGAGQEWRPKEQRWRGRCWIRSPPSDWWGGAVTDPTAPSD